ncbi:MAG: LCP family protein [Propionibacteriaceae bacterium]
MAKPRRLLDDNVEARAAAARSTNPPVRRAARRKKGHPLRTALIIIVCLLLLIFGSAFIYAKYKLSDIPRNPGMLPSEVNRTTPSMVNGPVTFLVLGSDARRDTDPQSANGQDGSRSDTMMLVYLPVNRQHVYVISLTRDMWVPIHNANWAKINAAYDLGKEPLTVLTVEDLLDIPIQHVATIDFAGFVQLMDLVGGVDIDNEIESVGDNGYIYPVGRIHLEGDYGLYYCRERKGLPNGDLDRTARQRQVVQAIIGKLLATTKSGGVGTLNKTVTEVAKTITVDDTVTDSYILGLAASMKISSAADVRTLMVPIAGYQTSADGQAANVVDWEQLYSLSQALKKDRMDEYYTAHKDDELITYNYDPSDPLPYGPAEKVPLTPAPTTPVKTTPTSSKTTPKPTPRRS